MGRDTNPENSSAFRFLTPPPASLDHGSVATLQEEVDRPPRGRRSRRLLGLAFLAALGLLLGLNGALALRDAVTVGSGVSSVVPGAFGSVLRPFSDEVRIVRFDVLRKAVNSIKGPVRIGLQVGHLDAAAQPDE